MLTSGCTLPPLPMERIAIHSKAGEEFYFFLAGTEDGLSFKHRTYSKKINRALFADFIENTAIFVGKRYGYEIVPVSYEELNSDNLKSKGFTAFILIEDTPVGGDETPSGIGICSEPKSNFLDNFGVDTANLKKSYFYLNIDGYIDEIDKYYTYTKPLRKSKSTLLKYPITIEYWPDSDATVQNMDMRGYTASIQGLVKVQIENLIKDILNKGSKAYSPLSDPSLWETLE